MTVSLESLAVDGHDLTRGTDWTAGFLNSGTVGAFLSSTDTASLVASGELVTNGTFDTDLTGWTDASVGTGTATWVSGELEIVRVDGSNLGFAYQDIACSVGDVFVISVERTSGSGTALRVGSTSGGNQLYDTTLAAGVTTITVVATTTLISVGFRGSSNGSTTTIDNVSVKLADDDRSTADNGLIVNGTVTRSAVATGAELVGYSGFSVSNYLEQPYNSDLDFGTGDFCVMGWLKTSGTNGVIFSRRDLASSGAEILLYVDASGFLECVIVGAVSNSDTVKSPQEVNTDAWVFVAAFKDADRLVVSVNGVEVNEKQGLTISGGLDNASAVSRVGLRTNGFNPMNGSLALVRISSTAPTADQIKEIYEKELALFQENSTIDDLTDAGSITLPNGKFPRILHKGNQLPLRSITASDEVADYPASAVDSGDTVDRWRPFANGLASPSDFSGSEWTVFNLTLGADGQTLAETTATDEHYVFQSYTFSAAIEHVTSVRVEKQSIPEIAIRVSDGTDNYTVYFNLLTETVSLESFASGEIVDLNDGTLLLRIIYTPAAAAGGVYFRASNGETTASYTGSTDNTIKLLEGVTHPSQATLDLQTYSTQQADCFAIAAHNLGSGAGRITFEHDRDGDGVYYPLQTVEPSDDSPILLLQDAGGVTAENWRITVDRGVLPEIGVVRLGNALQMERPFYGGATVGRMTRNTSTTGNISGSGQLLGRSKRRTTLTTNYPFQNLSYAWVRDNLDGPNGLIQSVETEPFFAAWRPSETQDVDYVMRGQASPPQAQGVTDLWSFSISGEAHSYE